MGIIACDDDDSTELSPFAKLVIGVCAMEKKAFSPPMTEILNRLRAFGEFKICMLADKVILEEPIEKWSECDCLIAFYSFGYPLDKAEAYAALRKPYLINELKLQRLLQDRRRVYSRLEECNIPIPDYAVVNRDYPYQKVDYFVEDDDYVEIHGKRIWKPFVEKPVDGDNHRVMIYYPSSAGGGMKELFRKIGNRSSEFHPEVRKVRRDGSYIYEEFMPTGGTDVKVYTIGPNYAHAEARKSPVVDGVVTRNADGKELRYPVLLTPAEKEMAREVCVAFGQAICGFDLLRSQGRSYVCDVNGWSFVKNSYKYYDDAACILRKLFLDAKAPHMSSAVPSPLPWKCTEPAEGEIPQQGNSIPSGTFGQSEELRCVIAILRHGDRTLKQKVKLRVTHKRLLDLMLKYNGGKPRAEAKLKSAVQLQDLLDATRMLVPQSRLANENDSEAEDLEYAEKLRHVKAVLEEGGHFSGIYRKVQLKPTKWAKVFVKDEVEEEYPTETLMVLKYGGVLTHAGTKQAEELGRYFRNTMYPGEGTGLLRLHSTYRHDSKIYSSDEGRVQMSAAAFAKGLLDLEGPLTPILVSLVSKDSSMLDGLDTASIEMEQLKAELYDTMYSRKLTSEGHSDVPWMIDSDGLSENSSELLPLMVRLVKGITDQLKVLCKDEEEMIAQKTSDEAFPPYDQAKALGKTKMDVDRIAAGLPCGSEGFLLMFARWKKLERDIYNEWKGQYDITKISVVYGSSKYDLLHNAHLKLKGLGELYTVAKALATEVIPNEYGNNPHQRLKIGSKVARQLLGKVLIDLQNTREEAMNVAGIKHTTVKKGMHHSYLIPKPCKSSDDDSKPFSHREDVSRSGSRSEMPSPHAENKETQYHLDPLCSNVKTPERRVRTRLYFTSESHIHSLMNVIRYCHLDDTLQGEEGLISNDVFLRIFETRELDYLAHIVLRMYENVVVPFEDPRRFRIELLFSCGAALSPLEASPRHRDHTLPVTPAESLLEEGCFLSLERLDKMIRPFAMPAEDFRAVSCMPHPHGGLFAKP